MDNKLFWNGKRFESASGKLYEPSFIAMLDAIEANEDFSECPEFGKLADVFFPQPVEALRPIPPILRPNQVAAVQWLLAMGMKGLLAYDMGTGKTLIAITAVNITERFPALVICPPHLKMMWAGELHKWGGGSYHIMEGRNSSLDETAQWTMINRDILDGNLKNLISRGFKQIVIDEAHLVGANGTAANKACNALCKTCRANNGQVMALTGTPVVNSAGDVHTILGYVDTRICGNRGSYMERFDPNGEMRRTIAIKVRRGGMPRWMGAKLYRELAKRKGCMAGDFPVLKKTLAHWSIKAEYVPDLHTERETTVARLNMHDVLGYEWMDKYDERMKKADVLGREDGELTTMLKEMAEAKAPMVLAWVKNWLAWNKGKIIIMGWHVGPKKQFKAELGDAAVVIEGTPNKKHEAKERFQNEPTCRVAICNVVTCGTGLTLTAAADMVFSEVPWNTAGYDQAKRRIDRIGQTAQTLRYTIFLAQDSVEEKKYGVMKKKGALADSLLGDVNTPVINQGANA